MFRPSFHSIYELLPWHNDSCVSLSPFSTQKHAVRMHHLLSCKHPALPLSNQHPENRRPRTGTTYHGSTVYSYHYPLGTVSS